MTIQDKLKSVKNTLSRDAGIADGTQCTSQLGWMLLLKILEDRDSEYEQLDQDYRSPLPRRLRWQSWARNGHSDEELLEFLNTELFPKLRALPVDHARDRRTAVIRAVFEGARNHATNGAVLRQAIEKLDRIDFSPSAEFENRAEDFEAFLLELHKSGEIAETYTPQPLARFMVDRVAPRLGESVLDPSCGTGSLLVATLEHVREHGAQSALDEAILQRSVRGIEKSHLPHLLATTHLLLNGVEVPAHVQCDNPLSRPLATYRENDMVDVVVSTLPFKGTEELFVQSIFPPDFQTRESADLFQLLVLHLLKRGGRAGIVVSDGALAGEGVKKKLRRKLVEECDLHTVVRLPRGVWSPQNDARVNLLFFTKGRPTREVWFYEHVHPEGFDSYTGGDPLRSEHLEPIAEWWGKRTANESAWKVTIEQIRARDFNLNFDNPNPRQLVPRVAAAGHAGNGHATFVDLEPEDRLAEIHDILLGHGALGREEAVRHCADSLRMAGLAEFSRLRRDSKLAVAIDEALETGLKQSLFDRPGRDHVRAILTDAAEYRPEDWLLCLIRSLGKAPVEREQAVRDAAQWAVERLGLRLHRLRRDSQVYTGIAEALDEAVELGEVATLSDGFILRLDNGEESELW